MGSRVRVRGSDYGLRSGPGPGLGLELDGYGVKALGLGLGLGVGLGVGLERIRERLHALRQDVRAPISPTSRPYLAHISRLASRP